MLSYAVTGASRGIGLGYIRALGQADPQNVVFGLVRNVFAAKEALELASNNPNVHILQADITDNIALKDAATKISEITGGSLDVLINNAACLSSEHHSLAPSEFASPEVLAQDLHKHVRRLVHATCIDILPLSKKSTVKKVVSIFSSHSDLDTIDALGVSNFIGYSVSKGALNIAIARYAVRFKDEGIIFQTMFPII